MKKLMFLTLCCTLSLFAKDSLTVYTYNSFVSSWGLGPVVKKNFEKECNCTLNLIGLDDGVSILNRLRLEGKNTKADVILGLDTNFINEAVKTGLIAKHKVDTSKLSLPTKWKNEYFIPYDFGYYALIYDVNKTKNLPKSMDEFLNSKHTIIYQDPRTSTVGFGLLLWLNKLYGDKTTNAWKRLAKKTVTITKGWSEAYNMFLKGEADFVLSYTTSPAYHMIAEGKNNYHAILLNEGHYVQTEVVAKLKNSKNQALADKFLNFVLSSGFQDHVATKNWMYPSTQAKLPREFSLLISPKALEIDTDTVDKSRKTWIKTWQNALVDGK